MSQAFPVCCNTMPCQSCLLTCSRTWWPMDETSWAAASRAAAAACQEPAWPPLSWLGLSAFWPARYLLKTGGAPSSAMLRDTVNAASSDTRLRGVTEGCACRWHFSGGILNPASMKQALVEGAVPIPGISMYEQGQGKLDLVKSKVCALPADCS